MIYRSRPVSGFTQRQGRSRWRRIAPVAGAALLAFAVGAVLGGRHVPASQRTAEQFATAWARGDVARMYQLTDAASQHRTLRAFARAYRDAEVTATATGIQFGEGKRDGESVTLPAVVQTRAFGTIRTLLILPMTEVDGAPRVAWAPYLSFPGVQRGEKLTRRTELPPRGALLARDRQPLARGGDDASSTGAVSSVAASIVGDLGPIPADRVAALRAQGVPADAQVGVSGLERVFDERLRGRPGGVLSAGARLLGTQAPRPAGPVRTTISLRVQEAALTALAGRFGGVVALRPASGEVLAAAGIPLSGLQPPGSTFKIVTVTAALEAKLTSPAKAYPIQTAATLEGVELENANGESCGGTLVQSFAHSCNSVFAPLGAAVGAERLVATARRFGFDQDPGIPGAATPSIPTAAEIGDDLALGSSAIGQGRVQATALTMALVGATIALDGHRPRPTFSYGERLGAVTVTSEKIAHEVQAMMRAVVTYGTGTAAAIPGITIAGKTGTAELEDTHKTTPDDTTVPVITPPAEEIPDTDAWFVGYGPAGGKRTPRAVVGVLLVRAGAGGDAAAPVARQVLAAALQR
jgi:transpeptidase family protein/penicillin-binding protein